MKRGKLYKTAVAKLNKSKTYTLGDAVKLLREMPHAKFDETRGSICSGWESIPRKPIR